MNAKDENGWTPLHYAATRNNQKIVEVLIKAGADIGAKDNQGKTPIFLTKEKDKNGSYEFIVGLLNK